jgi:lipoate-protein ligase A
MGAATAPGAVTSPELGGLAGLRWRVVVDPPLDGPDNMARDHALAATLPDGEAVLRFYQWRRPTLSLGRHEPARGRWVPAVLAHRGVDVVRRPTGGRSVLHHRELTYAVVAPLARRTGLRTLYRAVNGALVAGLTSLGVPARVVGDEGRVDALGSGPCFAGPAPGEVVAGGGKLVGSAQARLEGRLLQHGSLLLHDDQASLDVLARAGAGPRRDGIPGVEPARPATLAAFLDPLPELDRLVAELVGGFRRVLPGQWPEDWPGSDEWDTFTTEARDVATRLRQRYGAPDWTWRR